MFTDKTKTQEKETVEIVRGLGNINKKSKMLMGTKLTTGKCSVHIVP